jgi:hypothetical protein
MLFKVFRIVLRFWLAFLSIATIKKHSPKIIVVAGENNTSIIREYIYNVVSLEHNARRNLERNENEFSIPLTILGVNFYPTNLFLWLKVLFVTFARLIYLKPYNHYLVIELRHIDKNIVKFWDKVLNPWMTIFTDSTGTNSIKNLSYKIKEEDIMNIISFKGSKLLEFLCENLKININQIKLNNNRYIPRPRILVLNGINKSIIIDARFQHSPLSIQSVIEMANCYNGRKYILSNLNHIINNPPKGFTLLERIDPKNIKENDVYIIYSGLNENDNLISSITL